MTEPALGGRRVERHTSKQSSVVFEALASAAVTAFIAGCAWAAPIATTGEAQLPFVALSFDPNDLRYQKGLATNPAVMCPSTKSVPILSRGFELIDAGFRVGAKPPLMSLTRQEGVRRTLQKPSAPRSQLRNLLVSSGVQAGETFRECPECPEMVVVPAGSFIMGSPPNEVGRSSDEGPQRLVKISRQFAVGKFEVTFAEWDACVLAGWCNHQPTDEGWGRGSRPVINVSWDDAKQYIDWLSRRAGNTYRLLSEAEWEYAARAGTTTSYPWGARASHESANYGKDKCPPCGGFALGRDKWTNQTAPAGQFPANKFGLFDMHGNVFEWVEDCWNDSYDSAPSDSGARTTGGCSQRVLRGGSWYFGPRDLRSAVRFWKYSTLRSDFHGFRVARSL